MSADRATRGDSPVIKIYFEKPDHGRLGVTYAFRGVMMTSDDAPDYLRFRKAFEAEWHDRFPPYRTAAGLPGLAGTAQIQ
jgi:hypothetical protein